MRRIITFKRYFADFMAKLSAQEQQKIARTLSKSEIDKAVKLKDEYYAIKGNQ